MTGEAKGKIDVAENRTKKSRSEVTYFIPRMCREMVQFIATHFHTISHTAKQSSGCKEQSSPGFPSRQLLLCIARAISCRPGQAVLEDSPKLPDKQVLSKALQSVVEGPTLHKTAFSYLCIGKAACYLTSPSAGKEKGKGKNIDLKEGYMENLLTYGIIPYSYRKENTHDFTGIFSCVRSARLALRHWTCVLMWKQSKQTDYTREQWVAGAVAEHYL